MQQATSVTEELIRAIVGFPRYAYEWTVGLLVAILSDLHITALAVTGVIGGLVFHSILVGVFVFFATYAFSRVIGNLANAIGFGLNNNATATGRVGDAVFQSFYRPGVADEFSPSDT